MPKIISRADAKARGLKRYFTGKLCSQGHVFERMVSSANCVKCNRERRKIWAAKNKKRINERVRKKYYDNLDFNRSVRTKESRRYRLKKNPRLHAVRLHRELLREARQRGSIRYTGVIPCKSCGGLERYSRGGSCVRCEISERRLSREMLDKKRLTTAVYKFVRRLGVRNVSKEMRAAIIEVIATQRLIRDLKRETKC